MAAMTNGDILHRLLSRDSGADQMLMGKFGRERGGGLRMRRTVSYSEVPTLFEEPHVERGYRLPHQHWRYYLGSMFAMHNETINIWTHLVPGIYTLYRTWNLIFYQGFGIYDPYHWPLFSGALSCLLLFAFSSVAHLIHSKSEKVHYNAFLVDYAGIGLYGLGAGTQHFFYASTDNFYNSLASVYLPVNCLLAASVCIGCGWSKVMYQRTNPLLRRMFQMGSVGILYLWITLPIDFRIVHCILYGEEWKESLTYQVKQMLCFLIGTMFYATHLPESRLPGRCDYVFNSHNIFHVCTAMVTVYSLDALLLDIAEISSSNRLYLRHEPTFLGSFGSIFLIIILDAVVIWYLQQLAHTRNGQVKDLSPNPRSSSNGHLLLKSHSTSIIK